MTLRGKLLWVALSFLVLPVGGVLAVRHMEGLVREGQEQALLASAEALARALVLDAGVLPPAGPALFVQSLVTPPPLSDIDPWPGAVQPGQRFSAADGPDPLQLSLGQFEERLYLQATVHDPDRQPGEAHWSMADRRDHIRLVLAGPQGRVALRLANAGDGPLNLVASDGSPPPLRVEGVWREQADGYAVALTLPQGYRIAGLGVDAVRMRAAGPPRVRGTSDSGDAVWPLSAYSPVLETSLAGLLGPGLRGRVVDAEGWVHARAGDATLPEGEDEVPWWRRQAYRVLLGPTHDRQDPSAWLLARSEAPEVWQALGGMPAFVWRLDGVGQRQWLSVAVPLRVPGETGVRGALVVERENPSALLTADKAMGRLLLLSLIAFLGSAGVIYAFASALGWRIRRLRDAAETAFDRDGRLRLRDPAVLSTHSRDEIGDLSRSFQRLLDEIAGYGDYLQGLAGKLSHEINTPVAIVRGSLDNLDLDALSPGNRACVERARSGVDRLGALVRQMGEATRIERAIADADSEVVDLAVLVAECAEGYRPLLEPRRLDVVLPDGPVPLRAAPDLLAQALDKLVDNARSFCPEHGAVRIALRADGDAAVVEVANSGPLLPADMHGKLFDSLVSVRAGRDGGSHLGLGLYIVRLVAELHRGRVQADNLGDGTGVVFSLWLRDIEPPPVRGPGRGRP